MSVSVERLRRILLAVAILLVLVVAGFLGYARWRAHRFLTELPAKFGVDVRQETNAFTYSQTVKGRTVFTVHAAKAIEHKDGKYTLHDVGIAVYGHGETPDPTAKDTKQNERVDRIYGKEFDLDQAAGIIKAKGEVHIDLEAPAAKDAAGKMDYAAGHDLKAQPESAKEPNDGIHEVGRGDSRLIHVKTSNLVYLRKLGVAATSEEVEFEYNGLTGHAKGTEYYADTGLLLLQQAVRVSGLDKGKPILLTASKAELDRPNHKVLMSDAKYVTVSGDKKDDGGRQEVQARHAVVLLHAGGGVERINGEGGVTVSDGNDLHVTGDRGETRLNEAGKPVTAHITGNVVYTAEGKDESGRGTSSEANVFFDRDGHADRVVLQGDVNLNQRVLLATAKAASPAASKQRWSQRKLTATTVEMHLATDAAGKSRPTQATARGDARLHVADDSPDGKGTDASAMAADVLLARFTAGANGTSRLDQVTGNGKTMLERVSETGVHETSTGDQLEIHFQEAKPAAVSGPRSAGLAGGSQIAGAVQQGHVVVTRVTPQKDNTGPQTDHATASRANYDGQSQMLTLTGQVQLANSESELWTDQLDWMQKSGDAVARGNVKVSYRRGEPSAAIHVLADSAELKKDGGTAIFHGTPRRAARLWQEGSQIEAPVLEFDQKQRNLRARGQGDGAPMAVHTVLASSGKAQDASSGRSEGPIRRGGVVRVASREMIYSDASREANFTGGVRVESTDGVMRGDRATALLEDSSEKASKTQNHAEGLLGGSVERVTVTGSIEIDQPGRRATGERLVYTAADGLCVLTGRSGVPPRVVDQVRGVVTGDELRFRASDESVVISNGEKNGSGPRVHTETRVKRDR